MNELEKKIISLENLCIELLNRCDLLGQQIAEMKELYEITLTEVNILKEGGNL